MALWHKSTVFPDRFDHYCLMSINYFLRNVGRGSQKQTFTRRQWAQYFCFCSSLNIFSNHFDHYCLTSINYFLRNEGRSSQKRTFARRQWAQYLLFFVFLSPSFTINWLLLFVVNQLFSQKWSPKLSKANFCSKTVGTIFAVFALHSTSFPIILIVIVWCQSIILSEMEPKGLKSELLFEDSGHNICCFCSSFNIFSNQFDHYCLMSINYFLRNEAWNSQNRTFARRQWAQYLLFLFFTQHLFQSIWSLLSDVNQLFYQKWSPKLSKQTFARRQCAQHLLFFVLLPTSFQINLVIIVWC